MEESREQAEVPFLQRPLRTSKGAKLPKVESLLVLFTAAIMKDHSTSTYHILRAHCHLDLKLFDFTHHECGFPQAHSLEEHLSNVDALKRPNHNLEINPFNFSVTFYGDYDRTIVWFTVCGTEGAGGWVTNRESVHRVHWRRREEDSVWEVHMHSGLRGPGNLFSASNEPWMETEDVPVTYQTTKELFMENELAR